MMPCPKLEGGNEAAGVHLASSWRGARVWPLTARAQQQHRVRRIGVLMGLGASDPEGQRQLAAFERGLEDLGWAVGRNVQIDDRWHAGDPMEAQAFAKELSELHPDLLVAYGTSSVVALRQATRAIPIVFIALIDPVGQVRPKPGAPWWQHYGVRLIQ